METDNLHDFVCHSSPYCVIDVIEFFAKYNRSNDFEMQINTIYNIEAEWYCLKAE